MSSLRGGTTRQSQRFLETRTSARPDLCKHEIASVPIACPCSASQRRGFVSSLRGGTTRQSQVFVETQPLASLGSASMRLLQPLLLVPVQLRKDVVLCRQARRHDAAVSVGSWRRTSTRPGSANMRLLQPYCLSLFGFAKT